MEHLIFASSALITPLANDFSSLVCHGFMPHCFRDCVFIPVPKKNKDATCSSSYHSYCIGSKTLKHLILVKYSTFIHTSPLQFGFKPGSSTTLCTSVVKNIISQYIHSGSFIHGCFLDASKAIDLVDHSLLFQKLIDRGLPLPVVYFLSSWYSSQMMKVHWDKSLSAPFHVSNGVKQGGVLSPVLFFVTWMVCFRNWLTLVLVVIGDICLLVLCVMLMILCYWLHVHLHCEFFWTFVHHMYQPMV